MAALAQVSKEVAAAREGIPAGAAAKRDRGAEVRGAALIVKQTHVVVEVPLRLENSAADLAVESLGRGQCGHVASSSRRLAASAVGSALADPRLHGRLTEQLSIPLNADEGTCHSPLRRGSQRQHRRSRDDLRHTPTPPWRCRPASIPRSSASASATRRSRSRSTPTRTRSRRCRRKRRH